MTVPYDRTAVEAVRACACVLRHRTNRGYGVRLKTGMAVATYNTIGYQHSR
jgi:hypothetical protein